MSPASLAKQGRGVSCARSLANFLEAGDLDLARACARAEWDKLSSHPALERLISENLPWPEGEHAPWAPFDL